MEISTVHAKHPKPNQGKVSQFQHGSGKTLKSQSAVSCIAEKDTTVHPFRLLFTQGKSTAG